MLAGTLIHPLIFALIFAAFLLLTLLEFYKLVENAGYSPHKIVGIVLGLSLFALCFSTGYTLIPKQFCLLFIPFFIFIFLFEVVRKSPNALQNSLITLSGFVYIAIPFSLLNFIIFPGFPSTSVFYPWIFAGVLFIVWIYDSLAYLTGSMFGKHKMAKTISPKKSWEGLIGGAVFAIIMGILNAVIFQSLSTINWIIIAVIIILFG